MAAAALSDQAWAEICAASERTPHTETQTRAELSKILFEEYPAFAYDSARWAKASKRAERMLKHLDTFAELYRQAWLPDLPLDQFQAILMGRALALTNDVKTEAHFRWLAMLRRRPEAIWLAAQAIRRANSRKKSTQREWLYHRLCTVWLDYFDAPELSYGRPSGGGPPQGPLIAFMLAAIRQIMPEDALPSPETVRDAIDRERRERENARQLVLQLRNRMGD